ncbi:Translation initiation factor 2, gamma subunit, GTPase [Roseobacter sp. AzwK-3b]|nr:Translation initiation factor 2, gamma subunit, GTPase [Roseobacter sp. AzwK-3b]
MILNTRFRALTMKTRNTILATASLLLVANCATITRGSKDVLEIRTDPVGAEVQTSNGFSCGSTPCAIKMPRRSEFVVDITKPGCKPMRVNVTHKTAGGGAAGVAGNVLVGGVIGLAVDAGTGASQDLVPNPVDVKLEC